jgi:hypothetical protein
MRIGVVVVVVAGCAGGDPSGPGGPDGNDTDEAGFERTVGDGVLLYTGSGGNNWDTDADAVRAAYEGAGVEAAVSADIPADLTDTYGILVLLNPTEALPADVTLAAEAVIAGGGRVVLQTEHSGYGGHDQANRVLEAIGSTMTAVEDSQAGELTLALTPVPPLTDGVDEIVPFYAARVDVGEGVALGRLADDFVVIGYERVGNGDAVVIADGSMFGYSLDRADNERFIVNLASW